MLEFAVIPRYLVTNDLVRGVQLPGRRTERPFSAEDVLEQRANIDSSGLAACEERIDYRGPDRGVVVAAEQIVLPSDRERPDGVLHAVIVDVVPAVKNVAA